MPHLAKRPIPISSGINVTINGQLVVAKGPKGQAEYLVPEFFSVSSDKNALRIALKENLKIRAKDQRFVDALAGTTNANLNNMILGVAKGYEKKLELVGVGFRGQVQGKKLNLNLGFSHPALFEIPVGITIEMPKPTEIVIKGFDKQLVGQVAASIRKMRQVEPYKGKGIRYSGERVILKETKKK